MGLIKNAIRRLKTKKKPAPVNYGRKINRIIWHCTATSQTATVQSILNYFKNVKKWRSPGYHYMVSPDGTVSMTHHPSKVSNGVRGYNSDSINCSYIGGKHTDDRTPQQKVAMAKLTRKLLRDVGDVPVVGHRDMSPDKNGDGIITSNEWVKRCPSFDVKQWLKDEGIKN